MKRRLLTPMLLTILLAGCSEEEPVIHLDYTKENWSGVAFTKDDEIEDIATDSTLRACPNDSSINVKGDTFEILGASVISRQQRTSWDEMSSYKTVTYVKGKETYVICNDGFSESTRVERIKQLPDFLENRSGVTVGREPTVTSQIKDREQLITLLEEESQLNGKKFTLYEETLKNITPALFDSLYLVLDGTRSRYPILEFYPNPRLDQYTVAVAFEESEKSPYIIFFNQDYIMNMIDMNNLYEFDITDSFRPYTDLQVTTTSLEKNLKAGEAYPLYEFEFFTGTKPKVAKLSIQYDVTQINEELASEQKMLEKEMRIYLHQKPLQSENLLSYPEILRPKETDHQPLIDAIAAAKPTKKVGDKAAYHLLTLVEGMKDQQFEVSKKSRSKKTDIYITDTKTNKSYKLTSEGAETFISFFPEFTN